MWGEYPALVESTPQDAVTGMAYQVCSLREWERLVEYEMAAYRVQGCRIWFEDGRCTPGETFVWYGMGMTKVYGKGGLIRGIGYSRRKRCNEGSGALMVSKELIHF